MIIKNILIEHNNRTLRIEISDAKMKIKPKEVTASIILNDIIEDIVRDEDFGKIINGGKEWIK